MTKEEAIRILRIRKEYATLIKEDVLQEAIDLAIKSLSEDTKGYSTMSEEYDKAIEALSEPSIMQCGECKYRPYCNQGVTMHRRYDETIDYWSETIDFCSHGERREP